MRHVAVAVALATLSVAACTADDPPTAPAAGSEWAAVDAGTYVGEWTRPDGSPAERGRGQQRTFEMASRRMPDHCEWQRAVVLQVPWPLGSTYGIGPGSVPIRHYTRDADRVLPDVPGAFRSELELQATLPPGSRPTGYRLQDVELWFGPDDGEDYAYLVRPGGVERWPREYESVLCA